jgi:drug/metabolite transporter (DMT)-like permease
MALDANLPEVQATAPRGADNLRGITLMALAFFLFATSDTIVKYLTGSVPQVQIVWVRFFGLVLVALVMIAAKGPQVLKTSHPVLQVARGALAILSAVAFVYAITYVPIADAIAVSFFAPFVVTLLGALVLKERVGPRRWIAISIGFAGTLVVIRPGLGVFHPAIFLVLIAASAFAVRQVLSRVLSASDKTATTIAYTAISGLALLTIPLVFVWKTPETITQILLLLAVAMLAGLAEFLTIRALEIAEAAAVAPMHYTLMVWATFWGWLIFGQIPDFWTWIGATIVVLTGLYLINRERLAAKRG